MSAVGTVLLQSPGWNEGKARYETLGKHRQKQNELRRSGTIARVLIFTLGCVAPLGLNKCVPMINPGLAPWAMKMYRPCRAPLRLPNQLLGYFNVLALVRGWHPCEATAKCGARIILAPHFYQSLFSTLRRNI